MENDVRVNWSMEKENINSTIEDMRSKQSKLKDELDKELNIIQSLRDNIAYADREDKV